MWLREQLLPLARSNPEAVVDMVLALQVEVQAQRKRAEDLAARLAKNSHNSSKPYFPHVVGRISA